MFQGYLGGIGIRAYRKAGRRELLQVTLILGGTGDLSEPC